MPEALVVRGYCGTGKSTVAKKIAQEKDAAFLEYDFFLWTLNNTKNPSAADYDRAYKNFLRVLTVFLKDGKNIVVEGPLVQRTDDDPFRLEFVLSVINQANYASQIVQLTASDDVCVARMKKRDHVVPTWERKMFREKHDASLQEGEIVIDTTDLTIQQTIDRIKQSI